MGISSLSKGKILEVGYKSFAIANPIVKLLKIILKPELAFYERMLF